MTPVTVGVGINCKDGVVLACDSLATFSRGVPVLRYTNKVHVIKHDELEHPVAIVAAGAMTFFDKFQDRACRSAIAAASKAVKKKLDIVEFCDGVCEVVVSSLFKEYVFDRAKFFGAPVIEYSLSLLMAGVTHDGEVRSYHIHGDGLTER